MNTLKKLVVEYLTDELGLEAIPNKCGGVPLFKGTSFSAVDFVSALACPNEIRKIARDFDLDEDILLRFLIDLESIFDTPIA